MFTQTRTLPVNFQKQEDATTEVDDPVMLELIPNGLQRTTPALQAMQGMAANDRTTQAKLARRLLAERRAAVRYPCGLQALCRAGAGQTGIAWVAAVRNISQSGINLITPRPFSAGTILTVQLQSPNGDVLHVVSVRIVVARPDTHGWSHGCMLLQPLTELQLTSLLRQLLPASRTLHRVGHGVLGG